MNTSPILVSQEIRDLDRTFLYNPIVIDMTQEIADSALIPAIDTAAWFEFAKAANDEFTRRTGSHPHRFGIIAEAIATLAATFTATTN